MTLARCQSFRFDFADRFIDQMSSNQSAASLTSCLICEHLAAQILLLNRPYFHAKTALNNRWVSGGACGTLKARIGVVSRNGSSSPTVDLALFLMRHGTKLEAGSIMQCKAVDDIRARAIIANYFHRGTVTP